jgi:hypothetical protein
MASLPALRREADRVAREVQTNKDIVLAMTRDMRVREKKFVDNDTKICPIDVTEGLSFDSKQLEALIGGGYGDEKFMRAIACTMKNGILSLPSVEKSGYARSNAIKSFFGSMKQIGGESADGYAMLPEKSVFVVKAPRRPTQGSKDEMTHEYFVGLQTNKLRSQIPNFAYVLGSFECSPPWLDSTGWKTLNATSDSIQKAGLTKDRRTYAYCSSINPNDRVKYLIYENVQNSVSFEDFVKTCTLEQYLNVLTQVVFAIGMAADQVGFTHYDLHGENVLVKKLDEPITIAYDTPVGKRYVTTMFVATIIDFGRSHVEVDVDMTGKKHYGYQMIDFGLWPNKTFPMFDIFKILGFSMLTIGPTRPSKTIEISTDPELVSSGQIKNPAVFNRAKMLLDYFGVLDSANQNRYASYLSASRPSYYSLPSTSPQANQHVYSFFRDAMYPMFEGIIDGFVSTTRTGNVYGCSNDGMCMSLQNVVNQYTTDNTTEVSQDVYAFYDNFVDAANTNNMTALSMYKSSARVLYRQHVDQLMKDFNKYNAKIEQSLVGFTKHQFFGNSTPSVAFEKANVDRYHGYVSKIVSVGDDLSSMRGVKDIFDKLSAVSSDQAAFLVTQNWDISAEMGAILDAYNGIKTNYREIVNDNATIQRMLKDDSFANIKKQPYAEFLYTKLPTLGGVVRKLDV